MHSIFRGCTVFGVPFEVPLTPVALPYVKKARAPTNANATSEMSRSATKHSAETSIKYSARIEDVAASKPVAKS
jgi:hypothetical protein